MSLFKKFLILSLLGSLSTPAVWAKSESHSHKKHKHAKHDHKKDMKALKAHEHGRATLEFALESPQHIKVELKVAGADTVGFEHKAQKDEDRKKVEAYKTQIRSQLFAALGVEALGCKALEIEVDVDEEGQHSEWEIEGEAHCDQSLVGKTAKVDFSTLMPHLKSLQGSYVSETAQKSLKFEKGKGELKFE